ncbi:hypothetical protein Tco_0533147 [Tanacetum coccineum]
MSEFRQTSQFAEAVSSILGIVDTYLASKMKEAVDVAAIIKEQVQAQVSKIMPKIKKYVTESLGAEVLVRSTNKPQTSYAVAASLSEFELKKILIDKIETNKSIDRSDTQKNIYNALVESYNTEKDITTSYGKYAHAEEHDQKAADLEDQPHQELNTGNEDVSPIREALNEDVWLRNPSRPPTPDREWHKTKIVDNRPPQPWIIQMDQAAGTQSSFNEFLATLIDFSAFIMHQLKIDNLTQEVLTDPTYNLIKGTCKRKPYPDDLSKPLPLILNEQGRQVIPLDHFINNDLEYLKGGSSSKKYTTSITKTKAADYSQVKWIEDKVSRIWSPVKVVYDKHAYWGTYHWITSILQCADIGRKNILIENENPIANWLSNEVLYSVMNDVNTVSQFSELHDAYTVGQSRCLELEAEISKLKHKIQKDDYSEMIKRFSNLEIDHLILQLKYQNLKERLGNNKSQPSQDTPEFDIVHPIIQFTLLSIGQKRPLLEMVSLRDP